MAPGSRCCVAGCSNSSHTYQGEKRDNGLRFFNIPKVKTGEGKHVQEVTERRRRAWIAAIRRTAITFNMSAVWNRVCSKHFHGGAPAYEMMESHPDWAPSLHLGHAEVKKTDTSRHDRRRNRAARKLTPTARQKEDVKAVNICVETETGGLMSHGSNADTRVELETGGLMLHVNGGDTRVETKTGGLMSHLNSGDTCVKTETGGLTSHVNGGDTCVETETGGLMPHVNYGGDTDSSDSGNNHNVQTDIASEDIDSMKVEINRLLEENRKLKDKLLSKEITSDSRKGDGLLAATNTVATSATLPGSGTARTILMTHTGDASNPTAMLVLPKTQSPFRCGMCSISFSVNTDLVVHVQAHFVNKPYQCGYCTVSYEANPDLLSHVKTHKLFLCLPSDSLPVSSHTDTVGQVKNEICDQQGPEMTTHTQGEDKRGVTNVLASSVSVDQCSEHSNVSQQGDVNRAEKKSQNNVEHGCLQNQTETSHDYKCGECDAVFPSILALTHHWDSCHSACTVCSERFPDPLHLQLHLKLAHGEDKGKKYRPFLCGLCGADFMVAKYLPPHIQDVHKVQLSGPDISAIISNKGRKERIPKDSVPYSGKGIIRKKKVSSSNSKADSTKVFDCPVCSEQFENKPQVTAHVNSIHKADGCFNCHLCQRTFRGLHELKLHYNACHVHPDLRPHQCPQCGKTFRWPQSLKNHIDSSHGSRQGETKTPFKCSACGSLFQTRSGLRRHGLKSCPSIFNSCTDTSLDGQDGEATGDQTLDGSASLSLNRRPESAKHVCHICGKAVVEISCHLAMVHADAKRHICTICNRTFAVNKLLQKHMKIHCKPFVCDICGKSFSLKTTLAYHRNAHINARPYCCEVCGVRYNSPTSLNSHKLRHKGDKRYTCDICGKKFFIISRLEKHALAHSDQQPWACDKCGKAYKHRKGLRHHVAHTHNMN